MVATMAATFQRLPHNLQHIAGKLRELVEKQHAVVGQRNLARPGNDSAADQSGVGNSVVRSAKRSHIDQALGRIQHTGHTVDLRCLQCFLEGERGKNARNAFGQHGLTRTRWTDHQDVVAAGAGNFERPLGGELAANFLEVGSAGWLAAEHLRGVHLHRRNAVAAVEQVHNVNQRLDGIHVDAAHHGSLARIDLGDDQVGNFFRSGSNRDRQSAAHSSHSAIQRELSHHDVLRKFFSRQPAVSAQNSHGHGEIETRPFFLDVGGRQVDGDLGLRDLKTAVPQGGADALATLTYRSVGQTDGLKVVFGVADIADVDLNFNDVGVNPVDCGALRLEEHSCGSFSLWWRILQESKKGVQKFKLG